MTTQIVRNTEGVIVTIDGVSGDLQSINPENSLDQYQSTDHIYSVPKLSLTE